MSIEQDIKRMADAQERIVVLLEKIANPMITLTPVIPQGLPIIGQVAQGMSEEVKEPKKAKAGIAAFVPTETPVAPIAPLTVSSAEELRLMAQKIAQKAGAKTLDFTKYVNSLLAPYAVKTLLEVPAVNWPEVAGNMTTWAKKEGINA